MKRLLPLLLSALLFPRPPAARAESGDPARTPASPSIECTAHDEEGKPAGGARVCGEVKDLGGDAIAGAELTAFSKGGIARAASGADGRYALEQLAPGTWMVSVAPRGGDRDLPGVVKQVSLAAGDDAVLDFILGGGFSVSGRIAQRGKPLPGACVTLSREEAGEKIYANGSSRRDGAYRVAGLPAGLYTVEVRQRAGARTDIFTLPSPAVVRGDLAGCDITLPSGSIAGTLSDADGKPRKRVRVLLRRKGGAETGGKPRSREKVLSSRKSGDAGAFEFGTLSAGTYTLTAEKKGVGRAAESVTLSSDNGRVEAALVLKPGFPLNIRAVAADTGKPVGRAAVRVIGRDGERVEEEVVDAERGILALRDIPPGTYRIEVGAAGYAPKRIDDVRIGPGEDSVPELKLEKGATLSVTVSDGAGAPVAGAVVGLAGPDKKPFDPPGDRGPFAPPGRAVTGSTGTARFDSLPAGSFAVAAGKAGMKPAEAKVSLKGGMASKAALTLK